jgi:hypothetical protein
MKITFAMAWAASMITASNIMAAPFTPVPASNAADPAEDTYQESATQNCNSGSCTLTFHATTHAKTLVSHVSCFFQIPSAGTVFSFDLASGSGTQRNYLTVEKYGTVSGVTAYAVNASTFLFYAQGEQPYINVVATSSPIEPLSCTISGNYS